MSNAGGETILRWSTGTSGHQEFADNRYLQLTGYFMYLEICLYFSLYCTIVRSNTWLQTRKSVQLESSIIILRENHNRRVLLSHLVLQKALSVSLTLTLFTEGCPLKLFSCARKLATNANLQVSWPPILFHGQKMGLGPKKNIFMNYNWPQFSAVHFNFMQRWHWVILLNQDNHKRRLEWGNPLHLSCRARAAAGAGAQMPWFWDQ